ncbi:hypothetical protein [Photobacterium carnosum]|uniref:defense against restriction DarA-related protein n=1 Tax=Photobacterium carnosum TaxID=2023717 RepID=UPI001E3881B7|nr:hypothetical protein [Photobacterium carnosum]
MNPQLGQRLFSGPDPLAVGLTVDETIDAIYSLTSDPEQEALMMESVPLTVMDSAYVKGDRILSGLVLDAISTTYARFPRSMKALERSLNRGGLQASGIEVSGYEIGTPKKNNLFATVAVQFSMTDGQALTVIFHAPDEDPKIFKPDDMVVAFRWMLNKRDITQVVSPEMIQGKMRDASLQSIAKRVVSLVVANTEKFKAKQAEVIKMQETLAESNNEVNALTEELQSLTMDISNINDDSQEIDHILVLKSNLLTGTEQRNEELRAQISELKETNKIGLASQKIAESDAGERLMLIDSDLHRNITSSIAAIIAIDKGNSPGNDRSLFVNSIANKIRTRYKNGHTETVDATLDYIKEIQSALDKPLITDRNGVWKLHSNAAGEQEQKDIEANKLTDEELNQQLKETLLAIIGGGSIGKDWTMEKGALTEPFVTVYPNINDEQNYTIWVRDNATMAVNYDGSPIAGGNGLTQWDQVKSFILADYNKNPKSIENGEKPESVLTLESIVNGLHDDVAADDILEMIEEAVEQLEDKGLIEQYDVLIGSATEKYAELDEKQE